MRQGMPRIEQVWQRDSAPPIPIVKRPPEALRPRVPDVADELLDQAIKNRAPIYPLIALDTQHSSLREFFIRALDVTGSVIVTLLTLVPMAIVALLIKITSPGPVLYKQKRVGKAGKIFTLYKFRTMINNAEKDMGPVLATKDDPRVTPIGKVLRSTRIDELPQLFNIMQGDMSLVGPRPERPHFVKRHKVLQGPRLSVRPGLTGLAQIRSFYDLKPSHKIKYDYIYIQKRSTLLNIYILLQTIPVVFFKKGW
jgi:lipopolysaccharide/colanic/teichoic acid biosynthesis glycosyltransferase